MMVWKHNLTPNVCKLDKKTYSFGSLLTKYTLCRI